MKFRGFPKSDNQFPWTCEFMDFVIVQ